jgi:hypothetical protein
VAEYRGTIHEAQRDSGTWAASARIEVTIGMAKQGIRTPSRRRPKASARKRSTRPTSRASTRKHVPRKGLYGWITHTDLASSDRGAMLAPERVMDGVTVATVRAPGGVPIGFSGP